MKSIFKKALALSLLVSVVIAKADSLMPTHDGFFTDAVEPTVVLAASAVEQKELPAPVSPVKTSFFRNAVNTVSGAAQWCGSTRPAQFVSRQASNLAGSRVGTACGRACNATSEFVKTNGAKLVTKVGDVAKAAAAKFGELKADPRAFVKANPKLVAGIAFGTAAVGLMTVVAYKRYKARTTQKDAHVKASEHDFAKLELEKAVAVVVQATLNPGHKVETEFALLKKMDTSKMRLSTEQVKELSELVKAVRIRYVKRIQVRTDINLHTELLDINKKIEAILA